MKSDPRSHPISLKSDFEFTKRRFQAFWKRDLLDRPLVQFRLYKPKSTRRDLPIRKHASAGDLMLDGEYQANWHLVDLSNQLFLGDSLPVACPSLGPASMPAFYGCSLHLNHDGTSWNEPGIVDFNSLDCLTFEWENPWVCRLHELNRAFLKTGAGSFITGMSDWYTGADCLAAILGPQQLAGALIQEKNWVRQALKHLEKDFERLFLEFHQEIRLAGQPGTTWVPLLSDGRYYVITNDFSAMISAEMYRDVFLEGVIRECKFLDHSIYHLDGPDALRHLDAILEVAQLDGIHFIPSPGDASFGRWAGTYKHIQDAGKCMVINCALEEVKAIPDVLKPEGLLLNIENVTSLEEAEKVLEFLGSWPAA